ncbi:MAG: helix-turn-helix transcriptional regulator [Methylococcaceae bacterium]
MKVCEKIKRLRQEKGWSQEELANKLEISVNAYGSIERGDTDVNLSRLEEISEVFEIDVADLFDRKTNIVNNFAEVGVQNNQHNWHNVHQSLDYLQIKSEFEKSQLLNSEKDKEIALLKRIIELIEAKREVVT